MRKGIGLLGFFIIVLILIAGCTSPQSGAAAGTKSQKSGSGSSITSIPTSGYSSPQPQTTECSNNCPNMTRFVKFFPDVDGWQKPYPEWYGSGYCVIRGRYFELPNSDHYVDISIQDFSPCNYGTDVYLKNMPAGEFSTGLNGTVAYTVITYHGFPTLQVEFADNRKVTMIGRSIMINPKRSIEIDAGGLNTPSEIDAEIEKFANAIDFNGLAGIAYTIPSITTTPIKSRTVLVGAKYNPQDGMITVTNNGGSGVEDLSYITVSINGTNLPTNLDAKVGSVVTAHGTADLKNHIVAVAAFKDGVQQVIFDKFV